MEVQRNSFNQSCTQASACTGHAAMCNLKSFAIVCNCILQIFSSAAAQMSVRDWTATPQYTEASRRASKRVVQVGSSECGNTHLYILMLLSTASALFCSSALIDCFCSPLLNSFSSAVADHLLAINILHHDSFNAS